MFQSTDSRKHLSLMLSEVLDDIGINENRRMSKRRYFNLNEAIHNASSRSIVLDCPKTMLHHCLGSTIEGTTTSGLKPDTDTLYGLHEYNVIQDLSEWEHGKTNLFMIQDEDDTTPGYCFLQLLDNKDLPYTVIPQKYLKTDGKGRILLKNTILLFLNDSEKSSRHGPSITSRGPQQLNDADTVIAYPCKSWPKSAASGWLDGKGKWPTKAIRRKAAKTVCYVVPTGSNTSKYPELEWRISTSLAERCLMFDLSITQIKCYVLMKMILKYYLNPQGEINISSYMCKTVLFHCIEKKEARTWEEDNLLECLKDCLIELSSYVQDDNLSHFFIPENNLMGGKFTAETKLQLLKNISDFIQNDAQNLLRIDIDELGLRLQDKLNLEPNEKSNLNYFEEYRIFLTNCLNISNLLSVIQFKDLKVLHCKGFRIMKIKQYLENLMTYNDNDNESEHNAIKFLAPLFFSTYGSALASESKGLKNQVSPQAFVWLLGGLDSDISSGRLKLASVFYSTGDMEKTELILRQTENEYYYYPVFTVCGCFDFKSSTLKKINVVHMCVKQNEDSFKKVSALCVRFLKQEINCVPHELKYEMFRSTQHDIKHREKIYDCWMDWAIVDSLPFLYFLQYKVYRYLERYQDQQQALGYLANTIKTDKYLGHKETALNVLGQCLEQENRPKQAIKCYLLSLQKRARNNVARIHICRLLSSLLADQEI